MKHKKILLVSIIFALQLMTLTMAQDKRNSALICDLGEIMPIASTLKVAEGQPAPEFELVSVSGEKVALKDFRNKKNVVISFVPAAWTSVCSAQWPRYGGLQEALKTYDSELLGISVDNRPTLAAWIASIGDVWFTVLSDFWPHGDVASKFGVLRSDGMADRAVFIIDKKGVIQYARVYGIKEMPDASEMVSVLSRISKK